MSTLEGRYLVTGGAGFVGSHCVLKLIEAGATVVVLDNLRQGHREAIPDGVTLSMPRALIPEGGWVSIMTRRRT